MSPSPTLILHGGAGVFPREKVPAKLQAQYEKALRSALAKGWRILEKGGSALDAVERTVRALEDSPLFNAGRGSVLNAAGGIECDAAIMSGNGDAGAVAGVSQIKNPISLAREILRDSRLLMLTGKGAERFARKRGFDRMPPNYFITPERVAELREAKAHNLVSLDHAKFGTVGAVARDSQGNLAAATSTGGMTNKAVGRVGDSPIIGAGTYARNATCAVSCTGVGEIFIREVVGHEISARIAHGHQSLADAVKTVVHDVLAPLQGIGGVIAVGANGEVSIEFNSASLYRAWQSGRRAPQVALF